MVFEHFFRIFSSWVWSLFSPTEQKMPQKPYQPNAAVNNRFHNFTKWDPPSGLRPPTSSQTGFVPPFILLPVHPALPKQPLVMREPDLGIKKICIPHVRLPEKSTPTGSTSLGDALPEWRTVLPNHMINTEPIQTPVLETVVEPHGIITIPTQTPEEQERLYETGWMTKLEFLDDDSKLPMDLQTYRILPDKIPEKQKTFRPEPSRYHEKFKNIRYINPIPMIPTGTAKGGYGVYGPFVNHPKKNIPPPPPMVGSPFNPCVTTAPRMATVTIWIGEDPPCDTSAQPEATNGCRRAPIVYNPYLPKSQPVPIPTDSPPVTKKVETVKPKPDPEKKDEKGSSSWLSWGHWLNWQNKVYPMKLPDDTNPTIIWNPKIGCWVDTEENSVV